ncbi:hypothetical protein ACIG47_17035 [Promicromonospora sp. NPDC052451]|uniref:hypothetical protein n=1 Tax=Promicromonospora sp. NPDC052451 TaxID=3364407 RepID=UPI0037CACCE8
MPDPSSGAVGLGRALLWAVVVLALALTAHLEAGGHLPPAEAIALLGALLLAVTAVAVRRQVRWPGGLALAGLGQYALHRAFTYLGGACAAPTLPDDGLTAWGHAHPAGAVLGGAGACAAGAEPTTLGAGMLLWHVVATVVSVALLVGVERGIWLLASWLVRPLAAAPLRLPVVRRALVPVVPVVPSGSVDLSVAPERGPPPALVMRLAA